MSAYSEQFPGQSSSAPNVPLVNNQSVDDNSSSSDDDDDDTVTTGHPSEAGGHSRNLSGEATYDVPEGTMTETQVLLSLGQNQQIDRHGFVLPEGGPSISSPGVSSKQDSSSGSSHRRSQRHERKWRKMLGHSGADFSNYLAKHPEKVKCRVRKGIPDSLRGLAWQLLSGGRDLLIQNPGKFEESLQNHFDPTTDTAIMRDLDRTFPTLLLFIHRQGQGQTALYHVLRAYSTYNQSVGYVQGMGFICAVLLTYMTEEEAFWTLVAVMSGQRHALEGLYLPGLPLLQCCLFQFQELLAEKLPKLASHMLSLDPPVEPLHYSTHWFNTVFSYTLPFPYLLRVWDVFMLEGLKVLFRVGLAILQHAEPRLRSANFEEVVSSLRAKSMQLLLPESPGTLIRVAMRIPVSQRLAELKATWQKRHEQQPSGAT